MNDETRCSVVRDLLPGYIDNLTSEQTNAFVKAHLAECAECRAVHERTVVGYAAAVVPSHVAPCAAHRHVVRYDAVLDVRKVVVTAAIDAGAAVVVVLCRAVEVSVHPAARHGEADQARVVVHEHAAHRSRPAAIVVHRAAGRRANDECVLRALGRTERHACRQDNA